MDWLSQCDPFVRARDEDRWLSAQYAPPPVRARLTALYAVHHEIERAPALVSEAPLGEIRLQWWREGLAEIATAKSARAHPALEGARAAGLDSDAFAALQAAIDARARLLYGDPFRDAEDFAQWCGTAEGYLAPLAWRIAAPGAAADVGPLLAAATGFAMARLGRAHAPPKFGAIAVAAEARWKAARLAIGKIPAGAMPAVAHFALTRRYLRAADAGRLVKRLVLFRAVANGRI